MVYYYTTQFSILEEEVNRIDKSKLLEILAYFNKFAILVLDCETTGLNVIDSNVVMLQIGNGKDQLVIDTRSFDFSCLKPLLENEDILFVGHNIKFDYNMLKNYGIILRNVYDTMISEKVIFNGKYGVGDMFKGESRFSLAGVYKHYFETTLNKTVRHEFLTWGSKAFTHDQIIYGAKDVVYPLEIYDVQQYWINKYSLEKICSLENKALLAIGDIEYNGIHIDAEKWLKIHKNYSVKIKDTITQLDKILIEQDGKFEIKAYQLSLFDVFERERYTNVNWNSDVQVYKILTKVFNIYPEDKDGKPSSGTPALKLLDERPAIVEKLIQFRKESKVLSSFGKKFLEQHLYKDGRLRSQFNQIVDTGRMSSRNPNMQQIPKGDDFRGAFTAPKGKMLITADYSNQEGRIMADRANDADYIDFFNNGDGDAHSFVASKMFSAAFGKEFIVTADNENKEYRQKGKVLNFMISFGGSAFTLSKTLKIPIEEAEGLIKSFYEGFPTLKAMFNENKAFALKNGFIRTNTITNRIRWIPEWDEYQELKLKDYDTLSSTEKSHMAKLKGRIERKGMNTPIQGTAGDMTKTALILIRESLLKKGILPLGNASIKIVNVVHDEVVLEADTEKSEDAAIVLKTAMEKAGTYFCKQIAMNANPCILNHWSH